MHWSSLWSVHSTRFGNISKRLDDGILRRSTSRSAVLIRAVRIERSVESRNHTPCLRISFLYRPFPDFHHVCQPPIQPYITAIIQMLYNIFGDICQSFFISHRWLWFHLTLLSMPLHLRPHYLVATYRHSKTSAKYKYHSIMHSEICRRY